MKRLFVLVLIAMLVMGGAALAHHKVGHLKGPPEGRGRNKVVTPLDAPQGLVCPVVDDVIMAAWNPVDGATKYSFEALVQYDTDADGLPDTTVVYEDGVVVPAINVPLTLLEIEGAEIFSIDVMVKGLNPPGGPQNHPFSAMCAVI